MCFPQIIKEDDYLTRIGEILKSLKPYKTVEKVPGFDSEDETLWGMTWFGLLYFL